MSFIMTELRAASTLHNERCNIPHVITRSEALAISNNAAGPNRRASQLVSQVSWRDVDRPRPLNHRYAEEARQQYSALAQNQGQYHPYDYLSTASYNRQGRGSYTNSFGVPAALDTVV